jgi:hypothetical protein
LKTERIWDSDHAPFNNIHVGAQLPAQGVSAGYWFATFAMLALRRRHTIHQDTTGASCPMSIDD